MIIKSFVARNANEALRRVRREMGGEAIVLKTRQLIDDVDGPRVEVTACLESPSVGQTSDILTTGSTVAAASRLTDETADKVTSRTKLDRRESVDAAELTRIEQKLDRLLARPHWSASMDTAANVSALTDADAPNDIIDEFLQALDGTDTEKAVEVLTAIIEPHLDTRVAITNKDRVVVIGQAGVGKSSLIGKLAANLIAREKKSVTLSTLDEQRIAAYDELQSYAAILGADLTEAKESKNNKKGICLIDTAAVSRDGETNHDLKAAIADLEPSHCFAVVSATQRTSDLRLYIETCKQAGATHIVGTMLDLTDRWGSLLTACRTSGLKIAFVSSGPGGIGTLAKPSARAIAEKLLKKESSSDRA
jgi:flagellar biosynthesis protein FlhF